MDIFRHVVWCGSLRLFLVLLVFLHVGHVQAVEHDRIPPGVQTYQGGSALMDSGMSVYEGKGGRMTAMQYLVIYTKDDVHSVVDFYGKMLGMDPVRKKYGLSFDLGTDIDDHGVYRVPVSLEIHVASKRQSNSIDGEILFDGLEDDLVRSSLAGVSSADYSADLRRLKRRFMYLTKRWYPGYDLTKKLERCKNMRRKRVGKIHDDWAPDAWMPGCARTALLKEPGKVIG